MARDCPAMSADCPAMSADSEYKSVWPLPPGLAHPGRSNNVPKTSSFMVATLPTFNEPLLTRYLFSSLLLFMQYSL